MARGGRGGAGTGGVAKVERAGEVLVRLLGLDRVLPHLVGAARRDEVPPPAPESVARGEAATDADAAEAVDVMVVAAAVGAGRNGAKRWAWGGSKRGGAARRAPLVLGLGLLPLPACVGVAVGGAICRGGGEARWVVEGRPTSRERRRRRRR